ncbi:hypothetical protein [Streptomyces sp. NPDC058613]|uniref:hypothetical protein n=1 Tax=Streptomyces sp. NPDC058613 TaxID=3346556 RepID=UPI003665CC0E
MKRRTTSSTTTDLPATGASPSLRTYRPCTRDDGIPHPGHLTGKVWHPARRVMTPPVCLIDSTTTPDRCGNNRPKTPEPHTWRLPSSTLRHHKIPDRADIRDRSHQPARATQVRPPVGAASLQTDLELTRADNARLRTELSQARAAVQRQLGQQLDQLGSADLTARVEELTRQNRELRSEVDGLKQVNKNLERRLAETGEGIHAARTSLRRMIRAENQRGPID